DLVPAHPFGLVTGPTAAAAEKKLQFHLVPGVGEGLLADRSAVDGPAVDRTAAGVVQFGIGREIDDKADDGDRDDDRPQPGLMLSNCSDHNLDSGQERAT